MVLLFHRNSGRTFAPATYEADVPEDILRSLTDCKGRALRKVQEQGSAGVQRQRLARVQGGARSGPG